MGTMSKKTTPPRVTAKGSDKAAGIQGVVEPPEVLLRSKESPKSNHPPSTGKPKLPSKLPSLVDARSSAAKREPPRPTFAENQSATPALAVEGLLRQRLNLPHAHTARGTVHGFWWATKATAIVGPVVMQQLRAALAADWMDDEGLVLLAAVHRHCFGNELSGEYREVFDDKYRRGFLVGAQRIRNCQEGKAKPGQLPAL